MTDRVPYHRPELEPLHLALDAVVEQMSAEQLAAAMDTLIADADRYRDDELAVAQVELQHAIELQLSQDAGYWSSREGDR